jgi:NAD(P)H dehydrogenase (quinone)
MRYAVTGATGHFGRLAVEELLAVVDPIDVVALVRDADRAADLSARGVDVRVADYSDVQTLDVALKGVDKVLLVSGSEVGRRLGQHSNVIDAALSAGVSQLVYTSAPRATTTALILAPEHKATEEYLVASGLPHTIVRNNWYTENYVQSLSVARETGTVVAAAGQGRVASASRADYAAGAVAVLLNEGHEGKTYEFGGDHAWDFVELAAAIGEAVGREVTYVPVDVTTLTQTLVAAGLDEATATFVALLDQNIAEGALAETTHELSAIIGRPTTSLLDGLKGASEK